ncbi:MFS transporter [Bifidobacterium avesanii]|uniref:MFS transporter n=1 Tax=Bifidobacterium avesanii TaxID=1798157 RepID=A0A7K3TGH8_9BIFI|nr:glycoside-pentoside-hexuronide (GPH):cation symporter [Bifidobacterium avesanii]KAB8294657.1 MFS transporter [Bifidobacterium avesanii]NEG78162.1 MFS transporter [Bifidobacterium avesanii]
MSAATSVPAEVRPFGIRDKVGYLFGDFGNDFMFTFASSFLLIFYTKVMGINGGIVGTMFLIARIIDAFADVTVGVVVDKMPAGKGGKYRPVMMKMAPPVVIFSFLMYQTFAIGAPMWVKIVYMYVTYVIWGILYSCVNIPYSSMASLISAEPEDRTSLSTFRTVGSTCASLVIGVVAPIIIYTADENGNQIIRGGEGTQVFAFVSGVFAVLAILCFFACYKLCTERVKPESHHVAGESAAEERKSTFGMIGNALKSRSLWGLILMSLSATIAMLFLMQMVNYIYADYFGTAAMISLTVMCGSLAMLACAPIAKPLSRKIGHKGCAVLGQAFACCVVAVLFVLHTDQPMVFTVGYVLIFLGVGLSNMVCYAMATDTIDDIEVHQNMREDATVYSVYSFGRKVGQAIAGWISGNALAWVGYQSGATAVQTDQVRNNIYNFSTMIPAVTLFIGVLLLIFLYPLNKKRVDSNVAILKAKRGEK